MDAAAVRWTAVTRSALGLPALLAIEVTSPLPAPPPHEQPIHG